MQIDIESVVTTLKFTPEELATIELREAQVREGLRQLTESLELAEANAVLSAPIDGKNEPARKLQRTKAIADSRDVKYAKETIQSARGQLAEHQIEADKLRRQFRAAQQLADIYTAQLNMQYAKEKVKNEYRTTS